MSQPYILVEDFKAGLDTRRMETTSPPGTLQILDNAHISRGGEVEKAQAFVKVLDADPGNTFGLLSSQNGFLVFGSEDLSATYTNNVLNSNPPVRYQRLTIASGAQMDRLLRAELFDGKPYVIASFDDGTIHHFYDTVEVTDWFSNQGRATFDITGGNGNEATASVGSFDVSGGFIADEVTQITVDGVNLLATAVVFNSGDTTQDLIDNTVDGINAYTGTSGYSAEWSGDTITITSTALGSSTNGFVIVPTVTGSLVVSNIANMAGATDASEISDITVNAVSVVDTAIKWSGSNSQTAEAIVAAVRSFAATSGYTAVNFGQSVFIIHEAGGVAVNGHAVDITTTGSIVITPAAGITIENGSASPSVYEPGRYAKTVDSKMYILSGPNMHYSAIADPIDFTTGTGNGFDNLSTNTAGSVNLVAMANYFQNIAIFSRNNVHVWSVDADPDQNVELQVLNNTGAIAAKSVIEFGDNDVFYLSESGIRSLRARDSSNAAFVNDVGVAIDAIVQEIIQTDEQAAIYAAGVLDPRDSRYMLAISDSIFVFTLFTTSKVSAWSMYKPGFVVSHWAFSGQVVLCRAGDAIYRYGGQSSQVYDSTEMTMVLPFLDSGDPSARKMWTGFDIACEGIFEVSACYDPLNPTVFTKIATVENTTYHSEKIPMIGNSSFIKLKIVSKNDGYARVGNIAIHFGKGRSG